jgi:hypothetical protein
MEISSSFDTSFDVDVVRCRSGVLGVLLSPQVLINRCRSWMDESTKEVFV